MALLSSKTLKGLEVVYFFIPPRLHGQDPRPLCVWFMILTLQSLADFVDDDRDRMLLCPIRALKKYVSRTELLRPACSWLFVLATKTKRQMSSNTISFLIRPVIFHTYKSVSDKDCQAPKVKAYKVYKIGALLPFKNDFAVQQVLNVGTCLSQSTFSAFYQ